MAEDWDLYAVVRSCAAAGAASAAAETESENHLGFLGSLVFEDDGGDFGFPDLGRPRNNAFEELNQFYRPFFPVAGDGYVSDSGGFGFESEVYEPQAKRPKVLESVSSVSLFGAKRRTPCVQLPQQIQQREAYHQGTHQDAAGTSGSFTAAPPQISPRLRKRKSQQKRMVCEVTEENLSSDMWAWRKYGQKPIKGSPYPRNYYRCSSLKGCAARKQVEKSTTDPNVFIVTYTGDHIHPRPTHRNSLAGSTRNKISGAAKPAAAAANNNNNNPSCSSPLSTASLSPRTPLTSPVDETPAKDDEGGDDVADDVDEDDLLIPNTAMTEDIFMGLPELGYGSGFGHRKPKLEPSWTGGC